MKSLTALVFLMLSASLPARAGEINIAVASNFLSTAEALVEAFESRSDFDVVVSHGSTGQIFAQVNSGAPFDIFLSADAVRPDRLRDAGLAKDTRTYALGRLVLISREPVRPDTLSEQIAGKAVALADPIVAPYGLAATSAMERLKLDTATFQPILVANVGQAATIFVTRNAEFAFVAASLLPRIDGASVFDLDGFHPTIQQDAALLVSPGYSEAVDAFWQFLFNDDARNIIAAAGYGLP